MRKRHWYQSYNFVAPLININRWWEKSYKQNKKWWNTIGYIIGFIIVFLMIWFFAPMIISEVFADKWDKEIAQQLEMKRLEQVAIEKEKQLAIEAQETIVRSQQNWKRFKDLQNSIDEEHKYYEKVAKKQYPIGTYIKVDDWIGKIESIHGQEIITTDGFKCYFGIDDIRYSQYKEYAKFIRENSKG